MRKILLALMLVTLAAACKKSEPAASSSTTSQTTSTTATMSSTQTPSPTPTVQPTQTIAPGAAAQASGVVASTDGEQTGSHIDVTELKRSSGDTISLKFMLSNSGNAAFKMWGHNLGDATVRSDYKSVGGIHLVDPVNKKKYFVIRDSEQKCICSNEVDDVRPGGRASLWAKFPAPPADVQKITIEIPHFQPMDDVPIAH